MPDESCRKCGGMLLEYSVCAKCRTANQFICKTCMSKTLIRYHDGVCFVTELENVVTNKLSRPQIDSYGLIMLAENNYEV